MNIEERLSRRSMKTACGCILWLGSTDPKGYGRLHNSKGSRHVHRIAYELAVGPIPPGMELDHLCRIPSCVNPEHLEPVTRKQNVDRGLAATVHKARYALRTHCKDGHELTPENTYIYNHPDGLLRRRCRKCNANEQKNRRLQRRLSAPMPARNAVTSWK